MMHWGKRSLTHSSHLLRSALFHWAPLHSTPLHAAQLRGSFMSEKVAMYWRVTCVDMTQFNPYCRAPNFGLKFLNCSPRGRNLGPRAPTFWPHSPNIMASRVDTFFSGKNGARLYSCCSNGSSCQGDSSDTHIDGCFWIFGSSQRGQRSEGPYGRSKFQIEIF